MKGAALKRGGKLNPRGKRTKRWEAERARQKRVCDRLGLDACEIRLPGCQFKADLGMAHSKKRRLCVKEGLDEVVRACWECHQKIEGHPMMASVVRAIRAHRGEEYFICECFKLVTPEELRTHREVYRGVCCDECYLAREAA